MQRIRVLPGLSAWLIWSSTEVIISIFIKTEQQPFEGSFSRGKGIACSGLCEKWLSIKSRASSTHGMPGGERRNVVSMGVPKPQHCRAVNNNERES
ncbi:hypothetical protein BJ741DRAFT_625009 [Chytriomyces cf. hyalinus JEL632]|nr:hypothetical protein BJ741DRAFT_625009 [Chytriomyces cf. hyalinus JEL632]